MHWDMTRSPNAVAAAVPSPKPALGLSPSERSRPLLVYAQRGRQGVRRMARPTLPWRGVARQRFGRPHRNGRKDGARRRGRLLDPRPAANAGFRRRGISGSNARGRWHSNAAVLRFSPAAVLILRWQRAFRGSGLAHERREASRPTCLATGHQFRRSITLRQWKRVFIRLTGTCATRSTSSMNRFESG